MSPPLQWCRLWVDIVDDPKLLVLAPSDRWYYIALVALKRTGMLDEPDSDEARDKKVGLRLRLDNNERDDLRLRLMAERLIDGRWQPIAYLNRPPNWTDIASSAWKEIRVKVFARDRYTCRYCGKCGVRLECDHVIPISRGGPAALENLVTACFRCNRAKRDRTPQEWLQHG